MHAHLVRRAPLRMPCGDVCLVVDRCVLVLACATRQARASTAHHCMHAWFSERRYACRWCLVLYMRYIHCVLTRTTCGGVQRAPNACGAAVRSCRRRGFGRPGNTGLQVGAWLARGGHSDLLLCTHGHACRKQGCTGNRAQPVAGDTTHRAKWIVSRRTVFVRGLCTFTAQNQLLSCRTC